MWWYYNSQPSFKIEVQLSESNSFSSGGVVKIHQIYNFWLFTLKDCKLQTNKKVSCV